MSVLTLLTVADVQALMPGLSTRTVREDCAHLALPSECVISFILPPTTLSVIWRARHAAQTLPARRHLARPRHRCQ
jgi:hypothetical protein